MVDKKIEATETMSRELVITRLIDAPRELVFEVWTNPDHVKNWWGPNGFTNTISKMDVRPNGVWELVMHGPDGVDYKNKSIFTEVVRPERLAYNHVSGPKFTAVITFDEKRDKTLLTMRMVFETPEQKEKTVKEFKADEGLKQNINRLEEYLLENFRDRELNFTRTFNAPRDLVFEIWTNPQHVAKWWGPNGFTTTTHEMNVKSGGVWRFIMHGPDGADYPNRIEYNEVVKPERFVFDHGSDDDPQQFKVTVLFLEKEKGKTELKMKMVFRSQQERDMIIEKYGAIEGNRQTMNRLEEYLKVFSSTIN